MKRKLLTFVSSEPRKKEKVGEAEKELKEIINKNFPNLTRYIYIRYLDIYIYLDTHIKETE